MWLYTCECNVYMTVDGAHNIRILLWALALERTYAADTGEMPYDFMLWLEVELYLLRRKTFNVYGKIKWISSLGTFIRIN